MTLLLVLAACGSDPADSQPPGAFTFEPPAPPAEPLAVTEEFPVVVPPIDLLLVVDPALVGAVLDDLPLALDPLLGFDLDWRVGLVSTALGDPATAGARVDLGGPGGWLTPDVPSVRVSGAFPDQAPLGGIGAAALAIDDAARAGASLRVLIAQEVDDATPASVLDPADWATAFAPLQPHALTVVAPQPAAVLDALVAELEARRASLGELDLGMESLPLGVIGFTREYPLAGAPDPATLQVEVDDGRAELSFAQGEDYVYDEVLNAVVFLDYLPASGAVVKVSYLPRD